MIQSVLPAVAAAFVAGVAITLGIGGSDVYFFPVASYAPSEPLAAAELSPSARPVSTAAPTPIARPAITVEVSENANFIAEQRRRGGLPGNACSMPPSHSPDRLLSAPLTDSFGVTLNLECVTRPWRAGAPPEARFGPFPGVEELSAPPSAEVFIRDYVHLGQPFVVRRYAQDHANWTAVHMWADDAYLAAQVGDVPVSVRRSKFADNFYHFAYNMSASVRLSLREFIATLSDPAAERYYLGGQALMYGRQPSELRALLPDVSPLPAFATAMLDLKHINLWLGSGEIKSPAHYDNNEGLLVVLTGQKRLTLYPPGARNFLLPHMVREGAAPMSRMLDVDGASEEQFPCLAHARAMATTVTLAAGDLLYIPPYHWHSVVSTGRSCAVNLWFTPASALLSQVMKALDHSLLLELEGDDADALRPALSRQRVW